MFTEYETELLTKGLDALAQKHGRDTIMRMMVGSLMVRTQEQHDQVIAEVEAEAKKKAAEQQRLTEDIVVLKAKLIMLSRQQDTSLANEIASLLESA